MKQLICFDLDDTIIDSDYKFEITFCDCIKTILQSFETRAPQIDEVLHTARELDNHKLKTYPYEDRYQPQRLYDTWLETYASFCEQRDIVPKRYVKQKIKGIIGENFDAPWYVIPGAVHSLEKLSELSNIEMRVVTIGDIQIQNQKLKTTGLDKYFSHIEVVSEEKSTYLSKMREEFGVENVTMVGNSIKSDINAALVSGIKAIHIPRGSWHHHNVAPENDQYIVLKEIVELPTLFS